MLRIGRTLFWSLLIFSIVCSLFSLLLTFGFSPTLVADKSAIDYFPGTLDSFWVYEDQDGNELTRRAIEGEEIAGETFPAFSYEPELEDWTDYSCFIRPSLYKVSEAGITLVVREEVQEAIKARLKKEMDIFFQAVMDEFGPDEGFPPKMDVDIEAKGQEHLFLLPNGIVENEEWDVNQIEVNLTINPEGGDIGPNDLSVDFTIIETGIVLGTENVETAAGVFEDCLKVQYRTETTAMLTPAPPPEELDPPGETITTVWFAPNVGIVQFQQKRNYTFLELIPDDEDFPHPPDPEPITFKLKEYEIKTDQSESNENN